METSMTDPIRDALAQLRKEYFAPSGRMTTWAACRLVDSALAAPAQPAPADALIAELRSYGPHNAAYLIMRAAADALAARDAEIARLTQKVEELDAQDSRECAEWKALSFRAGAELARFWEENDLLRAELEKPETDAIRELQAELARCREALNKYGWHLNDCGWFRVKGECTCGLTDALVEAK
jgi:hypothetical protein